ncbi:hypothetical protein COLO4_01890, partial [Corchorus olitorius]
RDAGHAVDLRRQRPLLHGGHEGLAQQREQSQRAQQQRHGHGQRGAVARGGQVQQAQVVALEEGDQARVMVRAALEEVRAQHGRQEQRHGQRDGQRDRDGQRQRAEHLAFDALQRHQRQEHQDDDGDAEDGGRGHLGGGRQHGAHACAHAVAGLAELVEHVLHHHHGGIDHEADGDRQPPSDM